MLKKKKFAIANSSEVTRTKKHGNTFLIKKILFIIYKVQKNN